MQERIVPTKPNISEETKREMAAFFMKTSVPRILAERKKLAEQKAKEEEKGK